MLVCLSAKTFDIYGSVELDVIPSGALPQVTRRVSRIATVDGGVAINDGGYSDGDTTLEYSWRTVSKKHNDSVQRLLKLYSSILVSNEDGVYLAVPESFTPGPAESFLTLLVIQKLS